MIAFLLPNSASSDSLLSKAIPVDSLEKVTGWRKNSTLTAGIKVVY